MDDKGNSAATPNGALLYDTPVQTPGQDRLQRAPFASQLSDSILRLDADEGFVFSLNGPWGSGKTSIINLVLHYIDQKKATIPAGIAIVRFNPWWFSGQEHLIQQFFRQFQAAIRAKDSPVSLQRVGGVLETLAKVLSPLELLSIPGTSILTGGMNKFGECLKAIGKGRQDDVHLVRLAIDRALRDQKARILVVIDDIDRLPSDEIRHIFRLVKAVADFPRTIYLLAFETEVVVKALDETCNGDGQEYLEKIVQAPLDVPLVDRILLQRTFFEQLNEVLQGTPSDLFDQTTWGNIFWGGIDPFLRTPRQIKRLINRLRSTYPMVKGEVHSVDFIVIQTLRTFVPAAYDFVRQNKDMFAGVNREYGGRDDRDGRLKRAEVFLAMLPAADREVVKALLSRTFPLWGWIFPGGLSYGYEWLSNWRRTCRACSPDAFDRYFMLSIPPGDIGAAEMRSILAGALSKEFFAAEILRLSKETRPDNTTRLRAFWERMEDFTTDMPTACVPVILETIFDLGDRVANEHNTLGMFDFGDDIRMGRIVYQLLKRIPTQTDRREMLVKTMSPGHAVSRIVTEVMSLGQEHGEFSEQEQLKPEAKRMVSASDLAELKAVALDRIREGAKEKQLQDSPEFLRILLCWAKWDEESAPVAYVTDMIASDKGYAAFLQALLSQTRSHTVGDLVEKTYWSINLATATRFTMQDKEALVERAELILKDRPNVLSDYHVLALETLIREVRKPAGEYGRQDGEYGRQDKE